MFWRGRKRKQAAAAQKQAKEQEESLPPLHHHQDEDDIAPEPAVTSSNEEDETELPVDSTDDCKEEEEQEDEDEESKEQQQEGEMEDTSVETQPQPAPADYLSPEDLLERKRQDAMAAQKVLETQALARNSFCKNQRVHYWHKASRQRYEAVIVDVHLDDGVDRPYFTVRYRTGDGDTMEKQTTNDRLSYVGFDEAKTYQIISSKIKL